MNFTITIAKTKTAAREKTTITKFIKKEFRVLQTFSINK